MRYSASITTFTYDKSGSRIGVTGPEMYVYESDLVPESVNAAVGSRMTFGTMPTIG